jgi:hypothetical protein
MYQGNDKTRRVTLLDADDNALDVSTATMVRKCWRKGDPDTLVLDQDEGDVTISGASNNIVDRDFPKATFTTSATKGIYIDYLEVTLDGETEIVDYIEWELLEKNT